MKKVLTLVLSLALCVSMLVGCGGNTDTGAGNGEATKVLTCGLEADIDNFDPFTNQQNVFIRTVNFNCFEALFHYNENMELVYDLATSYEQVDEVTYTFKLREGVTFHNGEEFTADDVIYTINMIKDEATGAWRNSQYANVAEMQAIDAHTLQIKLAAPQAGFIDNLAYTAIVSKSTTQADLTTTPVGTGAFKFVSWTPNDNITFEKYEGYWDADAVALDKLVLKPIPDATVAVTNLESEAIQFLGSVSVETANTIAQKENLTLIESDTSSTIYEVEIGRHNHEAFADAEVMRAMFLALDRETVANSVFGGKASATKSPFPSVAKYYKEVDTEGYDLEKAKQVLAETDFAEGFEFDVLVLSGDSASEQTMVIWQDALKELGITMNIKVSEMSVWLDAYLTRSYDMIANYYSMVGTDPSTYCSVIMTALADYQTKDLSELNTLINDGANGSDEAIREQQYADIQTLITKHRPVASYVECSNLNGITNDLSGVVVNAMGHAFFKNASFK